MTMPRNKARIKTIQKVYDILCLYNQNNAEFTVNEVAQRLDINRNTARGLLSSLESVNILKKSRNKKYCLGSTILELANTYFANIDLRTIVLPHLKELEKKLTKWSAFT